MLKKKGETGNCNFNLPCYCHIHVYKYAPQIPHICQICKLVYVHIWDNYISIYASYELTIINYVTGTTGRHKFNIIGICPLTNMPLTLHICNCEPTHSNCLGSIQTKCGPTRCCILYCIMCILVEYYITQSLLVLHSSSLLWLMHYWNLWAELFA